jgi:hypothetical protein
MNEYRVTFDKPWKVDPRLKQVRTIKAISEDKAREIATRISKRVYDDAKILKVELAKPIRERGEW